MPSFNSALDSVRQYLQIGFLGFGGNLGSFENDLSVMPPGFSPVENAWYVTYGHVGGLVLLLLVASW